MAFVLSSSWCIAFLIFPASCPPARQARGCRWWWRRLVSINGVVTKRHGEDVEMVGSQPTCMETERENEKNSASPPPRTPYAVLCRRASPSSPDPRLLRSPYTDWVCEANEDVAERTGQTVEHQYGVCTRKILRCFTPSLQVLCVTCTYTMLPTAPQYGRQQSRQKVFEVAKQWQPGCYSYEYSCEGCFRRRVQQIAVRSQKYICTKVHKTRSCGPVAARTKLTREDGHLILTEISQHAQSYLLIHFVV